MIPKQTISHREGALSLRGHAIRLAWKEQDAKPRVPVKLARRAAHNGYSQPSRALFLPLSKINNVGRGFPSTYAAANWAVAVGFLLPAYLQGRRPFFLFLSDRCEQALQRHIHRFEIIRHCAFSNALSCSHVLQSINTMQEPKSCLREPNLRGGRK
ncbi:hypothetical protein ATL17_1604 [Maritalea mobilis]|uniref:Uncharacterized protein n=1 Tax=Maritalea mobilis TaxID=483324 RepID=A0A4R6VKJ1_9HYPH|nr:hypothetical protein ATL17_1604 [Maritalea mobilis]